MINLARLPEQLLTWMLKILLGAVEPVLSFLVAIPRIGERGRGGWVLACAVVVFLVLVLLLSLGLFSYLAGPSQTTLDYPTPSPAITGAPTEDVPLTVSVFRPRIPTVTPTPAPTHTPTHTPTPMRTPTHTPTSTPTHTPTWTPRPSPTPTPTPTPPCFGEEGRLFYFERPFYGEVFRLGDDIPLVLVVRSRLLETEGYTQYQIRYKRSFRPLSIENWDEFGSGTSVESSSDGERIEDFLSPRRPSGIYWLTALFSDGQDSRDHSIACAVKFEIRR